MDELMTGSKAMNVVLLETSGSMYSVFLPPKKEGRFTFLSPDGRDQQKIPLYIVAEEEQWIIHSTKEVQFYCDEECLGTSARIVRHQLLGIILSGKRYFIYTEEENVEDSTFVHYRVKDWSYITVGRNEDNIINCENSYISRYHACIYQEDGALYIRDGNVQNDEPSTNGTYVNGRYIQRCQLCVGDRIYIMGLRILIGAHVLAISNVNGTVRVNNKVLEKIDTEHPMMFADKVEPQDEEGVFDRQPRRKYTLEGKRIEISMPPVSVNGNKTPLLLRLGNPAISGGRALASGNVSMVLSSLVMPFVTQGLNEKDRKEYEERRLLKYREYLDEKEKELKDEQQREEDQLNMMYPALADVLKFTEDKSRLWERQVADDDFLDVRVGTGQLRLRAEVSFPREEFELDQDELKDEMYEVVRQDYSLQNTPVMFPLKKYFVSGIVGSRVRIQRTAANMISQICLTHSYDEVKLILLGDSDDTAHIREEMEKFTFLRHFWDDYRDIRFIAADKKDACVIGEYLKKKLEDRFIADAKGSTSTKQPVPAYVVFAFNKQLLDCIEILKDVVDSDHYQGVSIVCAYGGALKESTALLKVEKNDTRMIDLHSNEDQDVPFCIERCDKAQLLQSLTGLARIELKTGSKAYSLPKTYTFLEMMGAGKVEYLNPLVRWKNNNPAKSLATPIGIGTDGELFYLDLHQKRQGPHGLIAGMTGSGKSEFIITYILSLAVNFSPDEVAFVLIDYKGGGLTTAFWDPARNAFLPHVSATITNLDGAAIQRSMVSIQSELKRRQTVFNEAKSLNNEGTMDIYDYQKLYRAGKVREPMPHLFLIADEFAELKKQQPEFLDALISTARIGRSLGVHLILATQKPGGVVNDQIWSNSKFRVCLKVQDKQDSNEMIKRPEAAELKETGRFYLQVGYNEYFALGQSAWAGADYTPQEAASEVKDEYLDFIDDVGQISISCKPYVKTINTGTKQLVETVQYLSDLAKREHIMTRKLWIEELPKILPWENIRNIKAFETRKDTVTAMVGLVDEPEKQSQYPLEMNFIQHKHYMICGLGGSGKSTFLATMLYSLSWEYSPEEVNYYILDLSGGALFSFAAAPHCAAYLNDQDEGNFFRVITLLREMIQERKQLFVQAGVSNFEAYLQVAKLPHILLVIDSYTNIVNFADGTGFNVNLGGLLRDMAPYGIHFIASVNHSNEISPKGKSEIDGRIALQAKDKYDLNDILETKGAVVPPDFPGRGVCAIEGKPLEYHAAQVHSELNDKDRSLQIRNDMQALREKYPDAKGVRKLKVLDEHETYEHFAREFEPGRIPLGYSANTIEKVAIPLKQLHKVGLYFGNPNGVKPILGNLLYAAERNGMKLFVLRSGSNSVFMSAEEGELNAVYGDRITFFESTPEDIERFDSHLRDEVIVPRNVLRDEYCAAHGIPPVDKGRAVRAAAYIRERTQPHLYIIESMSDLCLNGMKDTLESLSLMFRWTKGYNIFFAGILYPEDYEKAPGNTTIKQFCEEQFFLMFGGKYDRIGYTQVPTSMYMSKKTESRISRFVMKYRDGFFSMHMPCGEIMEKDMDPDDQPIVLR